MRKRMERIVVPCSFSCASHSSVELGVPKGSKEDSKATIVSRHDTSIVRANIKRGKPSWFLPLPKPNVAAGIHRIIKTIKNFPQLFFYRENEEEKEAEMEIGFPTDVKHVTHIGIDGSTITNNVRGWDNLKAPELLSLSPISFKQFELAMATQAQCSLIDDANSSKNCC
ncbi:CRIB domain-containing protein RIC4 isoform X2 [Vigna radiata var. radiata]|uniref:CRIB domain-containing protein RIC4 isoform X2 n=1 Tax=Vigna radiata var. radiata TaxID=3916 RepID=A0A1S3TUT1_VIGRR|nr:CRIB domain-containing protein RIC4 isoform X2 [Vigna radiata var. radiata]